MPGSARDFQHQRLDHAALLSTVTKGSVSIEADRADELIKGALSLATTPAPGPVHVDLAPDVARHPAAMDASGQEALIDDHQAAVGLGVGEILAHARRPLVIAGLGVRDSRDAEALRGLYERHGIPSLA